MDSILAYDSESDNETYEPDTKKPCSDIVNKNVELSPTEEQPQTSSSICIPFFEVSSDDSSSDGDTFKFNSLEASSIPDGLNIETNLQCEFPTTQFWSGCDGPQNQFNLDYFSSGVSKNKSSNQSDCIVPKSKFQDKFATKNPYKRKFKETNPNSNVPVETNVNIAENDSNGKLNIFNIHPLISRHIYGTLKRFSYPKQIAKTVCINNSTPNRIAWSSPQYSHLLALSSNHSEIQLWDCLRNKITCVEKLYKHNKAVKDIKWAMNGKHLLTCSYDKLALMNDIETDKILCECRHSDYVTSASFHPIDHNIFITGSKNQLLTWDVRNTSRPATVFRYKDTFGQVQDVIFNKDGTEIFSCNDLVSRDSADRNIMAWDYRKGVVVSNQIYQERFTCVRLQNHPTHGEFYAQSQGDYIAIFSSTRPYKMNKCKRFEGHKVQGYSIGFDVSPDGDYILSGSADGKLVVYDNQRGKRIQQINIGRDDVCVDVAWHPVLPGMVAACTWNGHLVTCQ